MHLNDDTTLTEAEKAELRKAEKARNLELYNSFEWLRAQAEKGCKEAKVAIFEWHRLATQEQGRKRIRG